MNANAARCVLEEWYEHSHSVESQINATTASTRAKNFARLSGYWLGGPGSVASIAGLFLSVTKYADIGQIVEIGGIFALVVALVGFGFSNWHLYEVKKRITPFFQSNQSKAEDAIKYLQQKIDSIYQAFEFLHTPIHNIRDATKSSNLKTLLTGNDGDLDRFYGLCITNILDLTAQLFNQITGCRIAVGIMLVDQEDPNFLVTSWHSNTVPAERASRRGSKPTRLYINQGIAGRAFASMRPRVINDIDALPAGEFVDPWNDATIPRPNSLISCPFRVDGIPAGVVNIDSQEKGIFDNENIQYLAQTVSDFLAHTLQLIEFIKGIRNAQSNMK